MMKSTDYNHTSSFWKKKDTKSVHVQMVRRIGTDQKQAFDVVLLDENMPGMDGLRLERNQANPSQPCGHYDYKE